jgi:hypothetical protein
VTGPIDSVAPLHADLRQRTGERDGAPDRHVETGGAQQAGEADRQPFWWG